MKNQDTEIKLLVNSKTAFVDEKAVAMEAPAQVVFGEMMIPARFIGDILGGLVSLDKTSNTILLDLN